MAARSAFRIASITPNGNSVTISFLSIAGGIYTLWQSDTFTAGSWISSGQLVIQRRWCDQIVYLQFPCRRVRRFFQIRVQART